ncbi:MAG: tetratricopeptide repeat protein [Saprospirales bacterium]|nr:MAG: tetratricopeptide repeat protein [Saprospirales bacterium]
MKLSIIPKDRSINTDTMKNHRINVPESMRYQVLGWARLLVFVLAATLLLSSCGNDSRDAREDAGQEENAGVSSGVPEIDKLSRMIAQNPEDPELYHERATIYYERGVMREAIRDWTRAMDLDSLNPEYYHRLSDAFMDDNAPMLAIETMEDVVNMYPERVPSLLKLGEFYLIIGQFDEAIQSFNRVLIAAPNNPDALFMKGLTFRDQGDTTRAIRFLQTSIDVDPSIEDAYILLGQLHMEKGSPLAERYFRNGIRANPKEPVMHHALAHYLHFMDRLEEALEKYREMHVKFPSYAEGFYNAGLIHMELEEYDNAFEMFDMAVKIKPALSRGYFYRGKIFEKRGEYQRAKMDYDQARTLAPNFRAAEDALNRLVAETDPES